MSDLHELIKNMRSVYLEDPVKAVRGQGFIKMLHEHIANKLRSRLNNKAKRDGVEIISEAKIFGSNKPKDVDVALVHPKSGPLLLIGFRSQMSSVSKNVLTYYEDIIGECISLQERFPMSVHCYVYLHPKKTIKEGQENEKIDHDRYAKMYDKICGRSQERRTYKQIRGVFDHFAYLVADFENSDYQEDWSSICINDMKISNFVDRVIETFRERLFFEEYFD